MPRRLMPLRLMFLRPAPLIAALIAGVALAGCGSVPDAQLAPRLLSPDELQAGFAAAQAAPPATTLDSRAAALHARAAQMRNTQDAEDDELRRRALALAALGS